MDGKQFGEWLDSNGIDVKEAAAYFGVSEGSIYKWRSTPGVPDRKRDWVLAQMEAYVKKEAAAQTLDRVVLEVTDEQLRSYIEAAAEEGLYFKDWAIHVLDEAAAEDDATGSDAAFNPLQSLPRVAEPGEPYGEKQRD